jgi:sialate O-acetylesterase
MEYALPAVINHTAEIQRANHYSNIHIMSVGHSTQSATPLPDLQTIWHPWQVASNETVAQDARPGHTMFSTFSAVCWFFGQQMSDKLSGVSTTGNPSGGKVPIGLVSNNWGGTKVEVWSPPEAFTACGRNVSGDDRTQTSGGSNMFNAMVHPYTVGPMVLSGFTWFQVRTRCVTLQTH